MAGHLIGCGISSRCVVLTWNGKGRLISPSPNDALDKLVERRTLFGQTRRQIGKIVEVEFGKMERRLLQIVAGL